MRCWRTSPPCSMPVSARRWVPFFYDDRTRDLPTNGPWVRVTIQHNIFQQVTIGGRLSGGQRFRRFGIITVQLFTPSADGSDLADLLGNLALDIFEGQATSRRRNGHRY